MVLPRDIAQPPFNLAVLGINLSVQRTDPHVLKRPRAHGVIHMAVGDEHLDRQICQRADEFVQMAAADARIQKGGFPVPLDQIKMGAGNICDSVEPGIDGVDLK